MILKRLFVCHRAAKLQTAPAGSAPDVRPRLLGPRASGFFY